MHSKSDSEYYRYNSDIIAYTFFKENYGSFSDLTSERTVLSHEDTQSDNSSSSANITDEYENLIKILSRPLNGEKDNIFKDSIGSIEQITDLLTDPFIQNLLVHVELSKKDISDFCLKNNLLNYLRIAVDLIKDSFSKHKNISFSLEGDPETDEEWISLNIDVEGDIESIFEEYQNYNKNVIKNIPWPERDLIRLNYHLI